MQAKSLLSHSTILIFSAFLIGVTAGKASSLQIELMIYLTGGAGLIAYFLLGQLARRRKQKTERLATRQAVTELESRVDRHITRSVADHPHRTSNTAAETNRQSLTAVPAQSHSDR